ncbi:MAG: indole-3-glycerol phosphate synthase TrpC [Clostridiales bacterium]|jgi:indole-3-glycerol phosphate synthase|nr:indole-3-glycerol phosphate synthase TrpC [Clostridiales bacterium]
MILGSLADAARERVARAKARVPLSAVREAAERADPRPSFAEALKRPGMSFICEVKRASPSKGDIWNNQSSAGGFPYLDIAREYAEAGADALSVLTEPTRFLGSDAYLRGIASGVGLPVLRKDFTVDEYQIYEAKALGASAVLLIRALLPGAALKTYLEAARSIGLDALVETRGERELLDALDAGADIIGVNNRDLRTFEVDLAVSERLGRRIPRGVTFVAESGVSGPADARRLREAGADALLIGEALMRARDKSALLAEMRAACED